MASSGWAKATTRRDEKLLSFGICCTLYQRCYGTDRVFLLRQIRIYGSFVVILGNNAQSYVIRDYGSESRGSPGEFVGTVTVLRDSRIREMSREMTPWVIGSYLGIISLRSELAFKASWLSHLTHVIDCFGKPAFTASSQCFTKQKG